MHTNKAIGWILRARNYKAGPVKSSQKVRDFVPSSRLKEKADSTFNTQRSKGFVTKREAGRDYHMTTPEDGLQCLEVNTRDIMRGQEISLPSSVFFEVKVK